MHYFPTRARFVAEAVRHLAFKLAAELREQDTLPPALRPPAGSS